MVATWRESTTGFHQRGAGSVAEETPILRQWLILKTLAARHSGLTVQDLAHDLSVSL
jgi:hypothetical protein